MNWVIFLCVNSVNIMTYLLFVSRVKWPDIESYLGMTTIILAFPIMLAGTFNFFSKKEPLFWLPAFVYVAWAILAFIVDRWLKIEFRNPQNAFILIPFLILFYTSIGGMALSMWKVNFYMWLISGVTSALNVFGSIYASLHGKG